MARERTYLNELLSTAVLLALTGSLLYLLGDAFRSGFLAAFGVDKNVFPRSFEDTLLVGFESFLFLAPTWGIFLGLTIAAVGVLAGAAALIWHYRNRRGWKRIAAFFYLDDADARRDRKRHPIQNFLADWLIRLIILGVAVTLLLTLWTSAYAQGEQLAKDLRHRMDTGVVFSGLVGTWSYTTIRYETPPNGSAQIEGFIVESSPEFCAVYVDNHIVLIPTTRIVESHISGSSKLRRP